MSFLCGLSPFARRPCKKRCPKPDKGHAIYSKIDAALSHNVEHSILHRLPLELLYYLARHHLSDDTADILALRATSRAFRIPFISVESQFIDNRFATFRFGLRLRNDRFTRACAAEEQQRSAPPLLRYLIGSSGSSSNKQQKKKKEKHPQQRACARCRDTHPRWRFSAAQLARAPTKRRCKVIRRICPHWMVRYDINESGRCRVTREGVLLRLLMWSQCPMCDPRAEQQELEWLAAGFPPWSHTISSESAGSINLHVHQLLS